MVDGRVFRIPYFGLNELLSDAVWDAHRTLL